MRVDGKWTENERRLRGLVWELGVCDGGSFKANRSFCSALFCVTWSRVVGGLLCEGYVCD